MPLPELPDLPAAGFDALPSSRRSLWGQTAAAAALAVWRLGERSPKDLPWDLLFLVSLFWLLDLHVRRPRVRAWLLPSAVLALFAAYVLRHLPNLMTHLQHNL